jgi:hypothetical protein
VKKREEKTRLNGEIDQSSQQLTDRLNEILGCSQANWRDGGA